MRFGKYKGEFLDDVPIDYIKWLLKQDFCPDPVKKWAKENEKDMYW